MRIHGVKCDLCGKIENTGDDVLRGINIIVPEKWFTVIQGKIGEETCWHFCSMSHMYQWSTNQHNTSSEE